MAMLVSGSVAGWLVLRWPNKTNTLGVFSEEDPGSRSPGILVREKKSRINIQVFPDFFGGMKGVKFGVDTL